MNDQTSTEFDVLVIGELNMDLILDQLEDLPELGKEKIASGLTFTLGSSSAIFASNIARLGLKTAFCGSIGDDDFGDTIIKSLQQNEIDTSWIKRDVDHQTGITTVLRHNNDQAMVTYPGTMAHFALQDIPDEVFKKARHLHISSIFLQPGIKNALFNIIDKAKAQDMTISIDTQWDPNERWDIDIQKLISYIDFFLPNEHEFINMVPDHSVEEGLKTLQKAECKGSTIVKCGGNGAMFINDQQIDTIPAFTNAEVADTVGAGDSFNAGLIYRFLSGDSLEQCIKFGAITGAVSTTQPGGTTAIKNLKEVIKIAKDKLLIPNLDEFTN